MSRVNLTKELPGRGLKQFNLKRQKKMASFQSFFTVVNIFNTNTFSQMSQLILNNFINCTKCQ